MAFDFPWQIIFAQCSCRARAAVAVTGLPLNATVELQLVLESAWMPPIFNIVRKKPFIFALLGAVVLAFLFPGLGAKEGPLKAGLLSKAGS